MENHMPAVLDGPRERTSDFVSLDALGKDWGITGQGAKFRLDKHGIEIVRDELGQRAARKADLEGVDFTPVSRKDSGGIRKPKATMPTAIVESVSPLRPVAHFEAVRVGDSERVRRLLLALKAIVDLTSDTEGAAFAVWAVATYAIAAETDAA